MENKAQDKKEDKLILGGHEFNSRFILGSGKYNVNLIKAAVCLLYTSPSPRDCS